MYIMEDDLKLKDWEFSQRKYLPFDMKLVLTERRIKEWYENWGGNVYVSYSGGLDSTVLLHFVRKVLGEEVPAVFVNTGLEFPEIVDFARKCTGEYVELRPEKNFRQVILDEGYPVISKDTASKVRKLRHGNLSEKYRNYLLNGDERGKFGMLPKKWRPLVSAPFDTSEKCCDVMKKHPFKTYQKNVAIKIYEEVYGRKPKRGEDIGGFIPVPFIGTTQDESFRREHQYSKTGCNVYDGTTIKSQPLGFWPKQDVLRYVYENDIEICSVYGDVQKTPCGKYILTGEQRTGCMFCMFGVQNEEEPNRFQRMQIQYPKRYDFCMRSVDEKGLGLKTVLEYIGVPYETWEGAGQMSLEDFIEKEEN